MLLLIGIIIAGALVDGELHTGNSFTLIFGAFGGIPALGLYFKKELGI